MKILIAYDGSRCSEAAIDELLARPWPAGSRVRLVTVIEWPMLILPSDSLGVAEPLTESVRRLQREGGRRSLDQASARLKSRPDLEVECELREGGARQSLLEAIDEFGPDLVLAGTHGRNAFQRLLLGSVSQALVAHAPCSVEIVKTRAAA